MDNVRKVAEVGDWCHHLSIYLDHLHEEHRRAPVWRFLYKRRLCKTRAEIMRDYSQAVDHMIEVLGELRRG